MLLVDTSAWVEYLRGTGSEVGSEVRRLVQQVEPPIATTDVVVMELMAGARSDREHQQFRRFPESFEFLGVRGIDDFEMAAELFRSCRAAGATVRRMTDCLIAAVAIHHEVSILHLDRDFDTLARNTPLTVA